MRHQQNRWLMGCSLPQRGLVCGERGLPVHKGRLTLVSSCGPGPLMPWSPRARHWES